MTPLEEKINKHVDFIGSDFTEEGKKQLRESYEDIATQAVEEYKLEQIKECEDCARMIKKGEEVEKVKEDHESCHSWTHCVDEFCGSCPYCGG